MTDLQFLLTPLSMEFSMARVLEWVAIPSSRGSSQSRDGAQVSLLQADALPSEPPGKPFIDKGSWKTL